MHSSLKTLDHRPWPLPAAKWKWRQSWLDLAFIHYRVSADHLKPLIPPGIRLQEFDGTAWVGLVPFRMAGVMRRPFPDIPFVSSFSEMNLRTYVEVDGKPGVWFFSLDADSRAIVFGGRNFYELPYFLSRIRQRQHEGWREFSSERRNGNARLKARYRPSGEMFFAKPRTFEHWATERYCLYSQSTRRGIERVEVHHAAWPLQRAEVEIAECSVLSAAGITPVDNEPVCHFSSGVHAISFGADRDQGRAGYPNPPV